MKVIKQRFQKIICLVTTFFVNFDKYLHIYNQKEKHWTDRPLTEIKWVFFKKELCYVTVYRHAYIVKNLDFDLRVFFQKF